MQRNSTTRTLLVLSLVTTIVLAGCGGGGDEEVTTTGTWGFVDPAGNPETMDVVETDNVVAGTTSRGGTVSGGGSGNDRDITIRYPNAYVITLDLTIDGCTMTGTVTDSNGGSGTIVLTLANCGDGGGDIEAGVYTGTENMCMSMSGMQSICVDAPIQFYVDSDGQVIFGTDTEISQGGVHATLESSQDGNQFTLTTTATVPGGSVTVKYAGTVNGNTITGTISGSGSVSGVVMNMSGTFEATKA